MKEYIENKVIEYLDRNLKPSEWGHSSHQVDDVIYSIEDNSILIFPNGKYSLSGNFEPCNNFQVGFKIFLKSLNREIKLEKILK